MLLQCVNVLSKFCFKIVISSLLQAPVVTTQVLDAPEMVTCPEMQSNCYTLIKFL